MIYPDNFENKIQFNEIRSLLKGYCLSQLGKDKVDDMAFTSDAERINTALSQTREFRRMQEEADDFPLQFFFDMRASIKRIRIEGTHLEENEIFDLRRSLETISGIVKFLNRSDDDGNYDYPTLHDLSRPHPPYRPDSGQVWQDKGYGFAASRRNTFAAAQGRGQRLAYII